MTNRINVNPLRTVDLFARPQDAVILRTLRLLVPSPVLCDTRAMPSQEIKGSREITNTRGWVSLSHAQACELPPAKVGRTYSTPARTWVNWWARPADIAACDRASISMLKRANLIGEAGLAFAHLDEQGEDMTPDFDVA